jgi:regulation of enolase protein 1 (concanavalin A-like superfamily)
LGINMAKANDTLVITTPPAGAQTHWTDTCYPTKYLKIEKYGIDIFGSSTTSDWMMRESHWMITKMIDAIKSPAHRALFVGHDHFNVTDADPSLPGSVPGHRNTGNLGNSMFNEVMVCTTAVDTIRPNDVAEYRGWEDTPAHEFGHSIEITLGKYGELNQLHAQNPGYVTHPSEVFAWSTEQWFNSSKRALMQLNAPITYGYLAGIFDVNNTWFPSPRTYPSLVSSSVGTLSNMNGARGYEGNSKFTLRATGEDIWGANDHFQYAYQSFTGDGEITAKVTSLTNTDSWAKAGVMIRETLASNSANVATFVTPGNGVTSQARTSSGANTGYVGAGVTAAAPYWVRLRRTGNQFASSRSADGLTWQPITTWTSDMGPTVYFGIAATSHNVGAVTTAKIENLTIEPLVSTPLTRTNWQLTPTFNGNALNTANGFKAIDGVASTRWDTNTRQVPNQSFQVDMIQPQIINKIVMDTTSSSGDYPRAYKVMLSTDNNIWTTVADYHANNNNPITTVKFPNQTAQYVRVVQTDSVSTFTYWSIHEFNVFGIPSAAPSQWNFTNVNGATGSSSENNGTWSVSSTGGDIFSGADKFHFRYQNITGTNYSIVAEIPTVSSTEQWAKTGLMIRDGLALDAKNAFINISSTGVLRFQNRSTTGGSTGEAMFTAAGNPRFLKLTRSGSLFTGFYGSSVNGPWTQLGVQQSISMTSPSVSIGIASSSYSPTVTNNSTVTNFSIQTP